MKNEIIYPELGQKTEAQIEYQCSHNGGFYINTALDLSGRGIRQTGDGSNHKRGLKSYHTTERALEGLKAKFSTCYIANL